jgi:UDP-hydrolysing UDP-N-acetyl-D-glucosamine 2-epimerase
VISRRRRVAVVTGTRADYGLLRPTIAALDADDRFEVELVVCAMHLSPKYGNTVAIIEEDGFRIAARVPTETDDDTPGAASRRLATATAGIGEALLPLEPDILVLLGDRYEMLAAALAASSLDVLIAHFHGGELSEGSLDDAMRHAITKLAHLHLVAARTYAERVCQLGEDPSRVHVVGATGLEAIRTLEPLPAEGLAESLGLAAEQLTDPLIAVTLHPASMMPEAASREADEVVAGIRALIEDRGTAIITLPNDDPGNHGVGQRMTAAADDDERIHAYTSLGSARYLSLLSHADLMLGNSSSGVLEAQAFDLPVVNVGDRQRGRLFPPNVLQAPAVRDEIVRAGRRALSEDFRAEIAGAANPFGDGRVSERVLPLLAAASLDPEARKKRFFDVPGPWRETLTLGGDGS